MSPSRTTSRSCAHAVLIALACLTLAFTSIASAADLDASQRKLLASLASYTKQIETNVGLANDSAGPGDDRPADAKVRLARTRLAQPKGLLPQVLEQLSTLPGDHPDVAALKLRLEVSAAAITRLELRLDGKGSSSPGDPPKAASSGGGKLDYKQVKALSDGDFYVREIVGLAEAVAQVASDVAKVGDKDSVDHNLVEKAMNTVDLATKRASLARGYLDPLPPEGQGVKPVLDQLSAALASIASSAAALAPIRDRLRALVDPTAYPTLEADVRRMQQLASMYGDPQQAFSNNRRRAADLVTESSAAWAEYERFMKAFAPLVQQQTVEGTRASAAGAYFKERYVAFSEMAKQQKETLPAEVEEAIAKVNRMADTAVAEQKPAFFAGGIPHQLGRVEELVELLHALDATAGDAARGKLKKTRSDLKERQVSLRQVIIDANELPPNVYAGDDRAVVEKDAIAAWTKQQSDAKVLGVRIPARTWQRETLWRHQNSTWYLIDRSRLQALVLVKQDDKLAAIRPIDLWIDHVNSDQHTATPLHDLKDEIAPQNLMRIDQIK